MIYLKDRMVFVYCINDVVSFSFVMLKVLAVFICLLVGFFDWFFLLLFGWFIYSFTYCWLFIICERKHWEERRKEQWKKVFWTVVVCSSLISDLQKCSAFSRFWTLKKKKKAQSGVHRRYVPQKHICGISFGSSSFISSHRFSK